MYSSPLEQKLRAIVEPSLSAMGYALILVRMNDGGKSKVLQFVAERTDEKPMSVGDCEEISRAASALLDVADPIKSAYQLEVSSPGLERPLVSLADFTRFGGQEAKVEMQVPVHGRKRFRGLIKGVEDEKVEFDVEGERVQLSFEQMKSAKLVVTDALMKEYLKRPTAAV